MTINQRIEAFIKLRNYLIEGSGELEHFIERSIQHNAWFTTSSVKQAIDGIVEMLEKEKLEKWTSNYSLKKNANNNVGIIMAGNIPLVGFHDMLSVLISGNKMVAKLSSQDNQLLPHLTDMLIKFDSEFKKQIEFVERLKNIDAIIATGSDNTARYFEHYFSKYPNIIRKNRTSIGIINGDETKDEFKKLGSDIFQYYGLGCRNVSKLYVPKGYNFTSFFEGIESFSDIANHNKYRNNYDYNKSIYLVNGVAHFDNGFLLVTENDQLVSPISVLYYQSYSSKNELEELLNDNDSKLQCIVSKTQLEGVPFGDAQKPELWDYADNVDTLEFLSTLN